MDKWQKATSAEDDSNQSWTAVSRLKTLKQTDKFTEEDFRNKALAIFDNKHRPGGIRHREAEQSQIDQFLKKALSGQQKVRCLIVTGMPGAGKTLICTQSIKTITHAKHIFLNAVTMKNFKNFMRVLMRQLYPYNKDLPASYSVQILLDMLTRKQPLDKQHIIMVDEFDSLFIRQDKEALSLFDLFTHPKTRITLLATSNSMEMIQKVSRQWQTHLPAISNIVFRPYTSDQFAEILRERVEEVFQDTGIRVNFHPRCLKYIGCRLYNLKGGDMRKILEQLKKILKEVMYRDQKPLKNYEVTIDDATKICKQLQPISKQQQVMLSLPLQSQLVLLAVYELYGGDKGLLDFTLRQLSDELQWVNKSLGLDNFSMDILKDIVKALEAYGFLMVREKKNSMKMVLKISRCDIRNAFVNHPVLSKFVEQNKPNNP